MKKNNLNLDIFCHVIDNFGDAGVCIRIAKDLSSRGHKIRLFCSDLKVLKKISCSDSNIQKLSFDAFDNYSSKYTDVVINAFSYRFSKHVATDLAANKVLIINLEYLSAEKWVESYHGLPSFYLNLNCYFFFPGFTHKTGGILVEQRIRNKISTDSLNLKPDIRHISLFSYKNKNTLKLINTLLKSKKKNHITVFEGLALDNVNELLGLKLKIGDTFEDQNIMIEAHAMLNQEQYDDFLFNNDLNLVRGEDSIVRAILSGRPFLWQIYEQEDNTHIVKLNSFFDRIEDFFTEDTALIVKIRQMFLEYNRCTESKVLVEDYDALEKDFANLCKKLQKHLLDLGSLTDNLLKFIALKLDT